MEPVNLQNCTNEWDVFKCELVELPDDLANELGFHKAIRVTGDSADRVGGLKNGFVTYPLLSIDFFDDSKVMEFINKCGLVACPYFRAPLRSRQFLDDPYSYYESLLKIAGDNHAPERESKSPNRLVGFFKKPVEKKRDDVQVDVLWDTKSLMYDELNRCPQTCYLDSVEGHPGFIRSYFDDDKLLGTERLRAAAVTNGLYIGKSGCPDLLFSFEEVRFTLCALQVAAAVLQGRSYIEHEQSETIRSGKREAQAKKMFTPVASKREKEKKLEYYELVGTTMASFDSNYHSFMRVFELFFRGRPNLMKALDFVFPGLLLDQPKENIDPCGVAPHLNEREEAFVSGLEKSAIAAGADSVMLSKYPLEPAWATLEDSLCVFLEACVTSGWSAPAKHIVETGVLQRGSYRDGGELIKPDGWMWGVQLEIAAQLIEYLDYAEKSRSNRQTEGTAEHLHNKESWQICDVCGQPFLFKNTGMSPLKCGSEDGPKRLRQPSAPYCSSAHKSAAQRKAKAGKA